MSDTKINNNTQKVREKDRNSRERERVITVESNDIRRISVPTNTGCGDTT